MTKKIFPDDFAAMLVHRAGEKYRPSNGTEGDCFFSHWCSKCARDKHMSEGVAFEDCLDGEDGDLCEIIGKTFLHDVEDQEYPVEWQYGKDGQPCCTAFVPKGQPIPQDRCKHTVDMFEHNGDAA